MTLDEALGKVTDPEVKAFLDKMIKDQNSYITKLENQVKNPTPNAANTSGGTGVDDITRTYLEKNMRKDVIAEATAKIRNDFGEELFKAVEKDYTEFLDKNMDKAHTTVNYAVDAFALVLGRCYGIKDHPVTKVGKTTTPSGTPSQNNAGTNGQAVQGVQNILAGQAPIMTGNDTGSASGMPNVGTGQIKNTRDAFASLKNRFANNGGGKFQ